MNTARKIETHLDNPLTQHLDKMHLKCMDLLTSIRLMREDAKSGRPLQGRDVRYTQTMARELKSQVGGL